MAVQLLLLWLSASAQAPPLDIFIRREGDSCPVYLEGRRYVLPVEEMRLGRRFARLRQQGRGLEVRIGDPDLPYRCIGHLIYLMQRAGLATRMTRIGFISEPPPARR